MRKILLFILLSSIGAAAQVQRYDSFAATTASASGIGNLMQAIPNATLQVFNYPGAGVSCAGGGCIAASTFTSSSGATACGAGVPLTRPTSATCIATADSVGNFGFWARTGVYQYCIVATNLTTQCTNISVAPTSNTVYATQFSGADIFAQANAAAAALAGPGHVIIQSGSYGSVTTTLQCITNVWFDFQGVTVTWTGTSGHAINCGTTTPAGPNLSGAIISGPLELDGTRASGTIGLYIGSATNNTGNTLSNTFKDIQIGSAFTQSAPTNGFDTGIKIDGATTAGSYFNNFYRVSSSGNLHDGWDFIPTVGNTGNSNTCVMCTSRFNAQDGMEIDGAFENSFYGWDAESNGRYGINALNTRATQNNTWIGGDMETNTTADWNCGGATNFVNNSVYGMNVLAFAGNCAAGNSPNQMMHADAARGQHFTVSIGPLDSAAQPIEFGVINTETPPSGNQLPLGLFRTAANSGRTDLGSLEYPALVQSVLLTGGPVAGLTGTGACATTSSISASAVAGQVTCTGTTGASTLTITPGQTATHGYSCWASDNTHTLAGSQSSVTTTTCVMSFTTVTANDVITFGAVGY